MRKILKLVAGSLFLLALSVSVIGKVHSESKEEELKAQIEQYTQELARLGSQSDTLKNQLAQFNAQIKLTELRIEETQERISLLGGRIDSLEVSLQTLNSAFTERVVETYKMARLGDPTVLMLTSNDLSQAVSRYNYLQRIQEADRELLGRLTKAQDIYKVQKTDLETLEEELTEQSERLTAQKVAKNNLLAATKNDEKKYQQLLTQAKTELASFRRFITSQGGATILSGQTKCDSWGCYYNQRDAQWGNIGLGGSNYSAAEFGCLVSSVSMVASHYGKNFNPGDVAVVSSAFVPGTGYLYHDFSVNGTNVSISSVSKSQLDSELAAGRPVIAGLYSGPDHFIVILRKEGAEYIMHDPFMENGSARPLSDKYSVSNISTLRTVSFN